MLSLVLAFVVIGMGIKAMTPAGIPLTRQKQLHGTWAKVAGGFCLLLGVLFLADGVWSIARVTKQVAGMATNQPLSPPAQKQTISIDIPPAKSQWNLYTTPHGNITMLFPGIPTEVNKGAIEEAGVVQAYTYTSATDESALQVSNIRFDAPIDASEVWFDEARDTVLRLGRVDLASERTLRVSGRPAREIFSTQRDGMIVRVLVVVDGDQAHQVTMAGSEAVVTSPKADEVFGSLQILPPDEKADPMPEVEPQDPQQ